VLCAMSYGSYEEVVGEYQMAWPKLRTPKSPGHSVTVGNQSGAAQEPSPTRESRAPEAPAESAEPAAGPPARWPGGDITTDESSSSPDADAAEAPSFWDWAPPEDPVPSEDAAEDPLVADDAQAPSAAQPPKAAWKLVVTPVQQPVAAEPVRPGIGQRRGNLAHLSANPRMRTWQWRVIVAIIVGVVLALVVSWQLGLTIAVIVVIADTIYRSRRAPGGRSGKLSGAQRQTSRQLAKLARAGYRAMHGNLIPETEEQIDHLVVGPAGVFAIDSEAWDKRLVVRTRNARQLWHGPFSMKERLEHARWESERASELLSGAVGSQVTVRPAMAVYGPKIPWDVATIREVDVFSGPRLRKYLRRRARQDGVQPLSDSEVERIYSAANQMFPNEKAGVGAS